MYPTGGYGTFLDWCINWFSGSIDIDVLPFNNKTGSAHLWKGNAANDVILHSPLTIKEYLRDNSKFFSLRTHCNGSRWAEQKELIESYRLNFRKVILINNNQQLHLLTLHNTLTKSGASSYDLNVQEVINMFKGRFDAHDPIPIWQLREMMSYWHGWYHCYLRDMFQPIDNTNIININFGDLLHNFEDSLTKLFEELELVMVREQHLPEIKAKWLALQTFINRDRDCNDIISAVTSSCLVDISKYNLHLLDEAFIQWQLRDRHGLDLLCTDLNEFPRTTQDLASKLIPYYVDTTPITSVQLPND